MSAVIVLDPLLSEPDAATIIDLWHAFGSYGQYSNESARAEFAPELAQRYDATMNFIRTGGRFGRKDTTAVLAARTNYLRETYAYGDDVYLAGVELLRDHPDLIDAARKLHGREVVVPSIVYANILLPGQELATHTDVPEFRGANRKVLPQWLLVVMHHSGLFDAWRMPIATGISYFGEARGGELAYYPDGPAGSVEVYAPRHNTSVVLDTDSVFHGVDRVAGDDSPLPLLRPGMRLHTCGGDVWEIRDGDAAVATYRTDDLRYSVSWKAYCFETETERDAWATHADDLTLPMILDTLARDLVDRGRLRAVADRPDDAAFGKLLIDEYVHFPAVG